MYLLSNSDIDQQFVLSRATLHYYSTYLYCVVLSSWFSHNGTSTNNEQVASSKCYRCVAIHIYDCGEEGHVCRVRHRRCRLYTYDRACQERCLIRKEATELGLVADAATPSHSVTTIMVLFWAIVTFFCSVYTTLRIRPCFCVWRKGEINLIYIPDAVIECLLERKNHTSIDQCQKVVVSYLRTCKYEHSPGNSFMSYTYLGSRCINEPSADDVTIPVG